MTEFKGRLRQNGIIVLTLTGLLLGYSNCSKESIRTTNRALSEHQANVEEYNQQNVEENIAAPELLPTADQYFQCQFLSVDNIRRTLRDQLGLIDEDVVQYDENGNQRKWYVSSYQSGLGRGDMSEMLSQVRDDHECTSLKFKLAMEIFIEGCAESMTRENRKRKLFPNGISDVDTIYMMFTGRKPTTAERALLVELSEEVSGQQAEAAVCAAILTSVEVLDRS